MPFHLAMANIKQMHKNKLWGGYIHICMYEFYSVYDEK